MARKKSKRKSKKRSAKQSYYKLMGTQHGHTALLIIAVILLLIISPRLLFAKSGEAANGVPSILKQLEAHQEAIDELLEDVSDLKQTTSGVLTQIALLFDTYVTDDELDDEIDDLQDQLDDMDGCRLECTGEYDPVCGLDEKTYLNPCEAECAGISIYDDGACGSTEPPPPSCIPSTEVCDGIDNDCDGLVDETINFDTDENNCGSCGNVCSPGSTCVSGTCVMPSLCSTLLEADFFYDFVESNNPIRSKSSSGTIATYEEGALQSALGSGSADLSASGAHINSGVSLFSGGLTDFSIAFDYYYDGSTPKGKGVMTCGASVNTCGIEWDTSDRIRFRLPNGWQEAYDVSSIITNPGAWYTLLFIYDAGTNDMRLYVDGVQVNAWYSERHEVIDVTSAKLKLGLFHDDPNLYSSGSNNEIWDNWYMARTAIAASDYPDYPGNCFN